MKGICFALFAVVLVGCFDPEAGTITEERTATAEQKLVVCSSSCDAPTYNGQPVACASNIFCFSDAGAAYCQVDAYNWQVVTCAPGQPSGPRCGDGVCNGSDTYYNCPSDCPPPIECGNGVCEAGESQWSCPSDCCYNQPIVAGENISLRPPDCY